MYKLKVGTIASRCWRDLKQDLERDKLRLTGNLVRRLNRPGALRPVGVVYLTLHLLMLVAPLIFLIGLISAQVGKVSVGLLFQVLEILMCSAGVAELVGYWYVICAVKVVTVFNVIMTVLMLPFVSVLSFTASELELVQASFGVYVLVCVIGIRLIDEFRVYRRQETIGIVEGEDDEPLNSPFRRAGEV